MCVYCSYFNCPIYAKLYRRPLSYSSPILEHQLINKFVPNFKSLASPPTLPPPNFRPSPGQMTPFKDPSQLCLYKFIFMTLGQYSVEVWSWLTHVDKDFAYGFSWDPLSKRWIADKTALYFINAFYCQDYIYPPYVIGPYFDIKPPIFRYINS